MAKRKFYRGLYNKESPKGKLRAVLTLSFFGILFFVSCSFLIFIYYAKDLPRPENFSEKSLIQPTKIYDRTGEVVLYEIYGEEKRTIVPLEKVPQRLINAVIATEDANFYHHFGLDLKGIIRAVLANLKIGKPYYGASTISQQLIRSSFLTREKTMDRKIKEVILTLELERRYSKEEILTFYLNQIPFGSNTYGVEAASQTYFNKTVSDLSVAEAAALAALIQAPSRLSPYEENKDELILRKDYVISRMVQENYLTKEEGESAQKEEIKFSEISQPIKAPHFVLYVKSYLEQKYGEDFLKENGLKVVTSLDWELQKSAEEIVKKRSEINKAHHSYNASLVALDPKTGEILTMVGSADWYTSSSYPAGCKKSNEGCLFDPKFNIATQGERQPGSAFKPFAYALAMKKGFTPETILWDVKTEFNPNCSANASQEKSESGSDCYHPGNYDGKFKGPITMRQALAQSINIPAIKTLYLAGLADTIELAENFGITTLNKPLSWYGLSLVLGGGEVRLLDIVSAYGVFATEGKTVPPVSVLKIEDLKGNIVEENKKNPKRILDIQTANLINDILSDNEARTPIFGPRSLLYFQDYQVAVKTGTTQEYRDGWTIGYTPSIVVGVWVGNNNNSPMAKEPGVVLAGPIWNEFMLKVLPLYYKENFQKPGEVKTDKPVLNGVLPENHSLLYFINKDDPQGNPPVNPADDPQYNFWEKGVENWLLSH